MSIIIKRLFTIILFSSLCCFSQKPSDVYIIYKPNKGGMCNEGSNREGDNSRKINFGYKYSNGFEIYFITSFKQNE